MLAHGLDEGTGGSALYCWRIKDAHREIIDEFVEGVPELPRKKVSEFMRFMMFPYLEAYQLAKAGQPWQHCFEGEQVKALFKFIRKIQVEAAQESLEEDLFRTKTVMEVPQEP
jgi:hypothetical protein